MMISNRIRLVRIGVHYGCPSMKKWAQWVQVPSA